VACHNQLAASNILTKIRKNGFAYTQIITILVFLFSCQEKHHLIKKINCLSNWVKIYSTGGAFAAVKADGSITAWGESNNGGTIPASIATPD
jgi:hypothetical protein